MRFYKASFKPRDKIKTCLRIIKLNFCHYFVCKQFTNIFLKLLLSLSFADRNLTWCNTYTITHLFQQEFTVSTETRDEVFSERQKRAENFGGEVITRRPL